MAVISILVVVAVVFINIYLEKDCRYLIPVADIGNISSNFYQIKAEDIASNHIHSNDFLTQIKTYRDNIDKYLSEYEKTKMDERENKDINDFKSTYSFFSDM